MSSAVRPLRPLSEPAGQHPSVVLVSSVINRRLEVPMLSLVAVEQQDFGSIYKVPAGGNPGGGRSFDLRKKGCWVKNLALWSDIDRLRGVRIIFEDETVLQAGQIEGGNSGNSISFDPFESITESTISGNAYKTRAGNVRLQTSGGQKYLGVVNNESFIPSPLDQTRGILIGVYGSEGADLDSLGLILALPEDLEYQIENLSYSLDKINSTTGAPTSLNLKKGVIENRSDATIAEQLSFSHTYTETKTWEVAWGAKLGLKTAVKAQVPFLAEGNVELSVEGSWSYKYGGSLSDEKTDTSGITVTVPPRKAVRVKVEVIETKIDVPFTADLRVTRSDNTIFTKRISGTFQGATVGVYDVRLEDIPLKDLK